jgi:glutamine synthetase
MKRVEDIFGSLVFDERAMSRYLAKKYRRELKRCLNGEIAPSNDLVDYVSLAMREWAVAQGATHYTHWFQPLTGTTAEKHDSFVSPAKDGGANMRFWGKQLIQGEPDASSFPSGGLRATFEARGYTTWDITSPAFIKEDGAGNRTLVIPTAFCSYNGQALDEKTPLLRSMRAVSIQALRLLRALGNTTSKRVVANAGPEQEYFLVDREHYFKRLDLITSGRTLFGMPPTKGQELDDHYCGAIKDRVLGFMADLDTELWKMGVTSYTRHNEVAPSQYEMTPVYTTSNIATDQNQLVMETMQKVALRHGLVCLLHEKPFAGVNGSGKHNNWSLSTDDGMNLLTPGNTPSENQQFLLVLCALLRGIDRHADILRATAASAGNDHRLGANEAPPAIISIFLGDELSDMLFALASGERYEAAKRRFVQVGVDTLPDLPKDNTDRNRTSPLAFTGNKFEFRMVGSAASTAGPNTAINTIVAEALSEIASRLEHAADRKAESQAIIREIVNEHKRIIYNGNGYSEDWLAEAARRGLPNAANTVDALDALVSERAYALFEKFAVLTREELRSRYEIHLERYAKQLLIEGRCAINMCRKQYLPAVLAFSGELADVVSKTKAAGFSSSTAIALLGKITAMLEELALCIESLEQAVHKTENAEPHEHARLARDEVLRALEGLRLVVDRLEGIVPQDAWPVPGYEDILYRQ